MAMAPPCPRSGRVAWAQSPTPVRQPSNQGLPASTCLQHVLAVCPQADRIGPVSGKMTSAASGQSLGARRAYAFSRWLGCQTWNRDFGSPQAAGLARLPTLPLDPTSIIGPRQEWP